VATLQCFKQLVGVTAFRTVIRSSRTGPMVEFVASVQVKLVLGSCFMHLDTFEVFFDDLSITPIPAQVLIQPDTLNLKSGGKWIFMGLESIDSPTNDLQYWLSRPAEERVAPEIV
jgi:hypothetical protein